MVVVVVLRRGRSKPSTGFPPTMRSFSLGLTTGRLSRPWPNRAIPSWFTNGLPITSGGYRQKRHKSQSSLCRLIYMFIYFSNTIKKQNKRMTSHQKLCVHLHRAPLSWVYPASPGEFVHPDSSEPLVPSQPPGVTEKGFTKNVEKSITDIMLQYSAVQYSTLHYMTDYSYPFGSIWSCDRLLTNSFADSTIRGVFRICCCQVGSSIST